MLSARQSCKSSARAGATQKGAADAQRGQEGGMTTDLSAAPARRNIGAGDIATRGPEAEERRKGSLQMRRGRRPLYDGYLLQETRLMFQELEAAEPSLARLGLRARLPSAGQSTACVEGSRGGVAAIAENQFCTRYCREHGKKGSASLSTAGKPSDSSELLSFSGWVPMVWHMRGYPITAISIYLERHKPLRTGPHADPLKEIG